MTPEEKQKYLTLRKERGNLKKHLESLTTVVRKALIALDDEMGKPPDVERGRRVAKISNIFAHNCIYNFNSRIF